MKLTEPLLSKYLSDPLGYDEEVRVNLKIPDNKYYSITTFSLISPDKIGSAYIISKGERVVKLKKISKSN
jgi:hypothetical protein